MKRKNLDIFDIIYNIIITICLCGGFFSQVSGIKELRFITYSGLFVGLILCWMYGFERWRIIPAYIKCYLILIIYGLICCLIPNTSNYSFNYVIFWLSAVLLFISGLSFEIKITAINIVFLISQMIFVKDVNVDFSVLAFMKSSTSSAEINAPAFVFPLFIVYYLYKNVKWRTTMIILNTLAIIIFFKRIVFLAFLVCILIFCFQKFVHKNTFRHINPIFFVLANVVYIGFIFAFADGTFNDFLHQYSGISIGELSMGRNSLYRILTKDLISSDFLTILGGHGTAAAYQILSPLKIGDLHNDVLKILFDNGMIVFIMFFYYLYKEADNWPKLSLAIMMNIFFLTDNTLVYTIVIIAFFLINHEFKTNVLSDETELLSSN